MGHVYQIGGKGVHGCQCWTGPLIAQLRSVVSALQTWMRLTERWLGTIDNLQVKWGAEDDYEIICKIGRGKYLEVRGSYYLRPQSESNRRSQVFEGVNIVTDERCFINVLKPVKEKKIRREIKILQNLTGGPNIVGLLDVIRDPSSMTPSLITEYVHDVDFRILYPRFKDFDVRYYILELPRVCRLILCKNDCNSNRCRLWISVIRRALCTEMWGPTMLWLILKIGR